MSTSCVKPILIKLPESSARVHVPCGKCYECRLRHASDWSFRLNWEARASVYSLFLTLTYDETHAPRSKNGYLTLRADDVSGFIKRLRKLYSGSKVSGIKYYAVGEYGSKRGRPHYHLLLFFRRCGTYDKKSLGNSLSRYQGRRFDPFRAINAAWKLGHVHFGNVTPASVGYCLKYMSKQGWKAKHKNDDRAPLFARMSKGIGESYLTPNMIAWHKDDLENRMYCNLDGGKKKSMPRYYKDRIYNSEERGYLKGYFERYRNLKDAKIVYEQSIKPIQTNRDREQQIEYSFIKVNMVYEQTVF